MLGGIDPVIIFQFSRNVDESFVGPPEPSPIARIPVISQIPTVVDEPPIPIYLSESFTGIYIDTEDKNIDIQTETETRTDGQAPDVNQKGIANIVTVNLLAKKTSIYLAVLSVMSDVLFDKVTSKEYAVTYMHGPIIVFRGLLHSISLSQNSDNDLMSVKIEITKGSKNPTKASPIAAVPGSTGILPGG